MSNEINEEVAVQIAMDLFVAHRYRPEDCFKLAREFLEYREAERQRIKNCMRRDHE